MKKFLIFCFLISSANVYAQRVIRSEQVTDYSIYVMGDKFEGVIFDAKYSPKGAEGYIKDKGRFTPSIKEIETAEKLLIPGVKIFSQKRRDDGRANFVQRNFKKYLRQYIGYINEKNEKVIFITALWKKDEVSEEEIKQTIKSYPYHSWKEEYKWVADGGNYYWEAEINLNTNLLSSFGTHGVA